MPESQHRLAMLDLATDADERFVVDDCELEREGVSYSIETVRAMRQRYPEDQLYFIIGSDSLVELHLWRDIEALLELCTFVTVPRPGISREELTVDRLSLPAPWPERLLETIIDGNAPDISSSGIRKRIAEGEGCRYLVPDSVCEYIQEHGLYLHD